MAFGNVGMNMRWKKKQVAQGLDIGMFWVDPRVLTCSTSLKPSIATIRDKNYAIEMESISKAMLIFELGSVMRRSSL